MTESRKTSPMRRFFESRLFLIAALIVVFLIAFGYARAYYQDFKIREEISALELEVKTLERKKIESLEILDYVISDSFVEDAARTELNLKKPGEKVIIMDRQEGESSITGASDFDAEGNVSNIQKWLEYFGFKHVDRQ